MAAGPTLVLVIREGKNEATLVEVRMTDMLSGPQLTSIMGMALAKMRNTIIKDGFKIRDMAVAHIRRWRGR